ncbi:alpha-N-acetylgalactosamine-specific lectin-like [Babylonia areolata]|uniref:alpha-N-acetylgalactosamine-specific lectin-like n=1 Tax=Babylonia areolata TaxID=304850 RepID=UPI003FD56225
MEVIFLVQVFAADSKKVPDNGYTLRCGRCLRFVPTLMLYDQAKQLCAQLDNGHLPVVKTLEELLCVRDFTTENGWNFGYVALADQQTYVWFDGTAVASDSPLWGRSQPDQRPGEFCVGIRGTDGGMHDLYCESYNGYPVCQKDL